MTSKHSLSHMQIRGTLLVAVSGMLYGVMSYCGTKLFREHFTLQAMLFWRFFVAMLWIVSSNLVVGKNIFQHINNDSNLMKTVLLGAITYSVGSASYFLAALHIGTGLAMVIFFLFPVFVTLFAWILSDWRMNGYAFCSLLAVIIGLLLLKGTGSDALDTGGIFFAIIAALFYAIYIYRSQHSAKTINSRLLTFLICFGNAAIFLLLCCYTHTFIFPTTFKAWVYILAIGIVATAVPIQLLLDGLKYISPIKASILSVLEPVVTVIVGLSLLGETISSFQAVGIVIVLLGAILIQFEKVSYQHEGQ